MKNKINIISQIEKTNKGQTVPSMQGSSRRTTFRISPAALVLVRYPVLPASSVLFYSIPLFFKRSNSY